MKGSENRSGLKTLICVVHDIAAAEWSQWSIPRAKDLEIENIRETFRPEKLTIIDCDAEIHNIYDVEKYDNILELEFHGYGGTDF